MIDENNQSEVTALENTETRSSNLSVYEKEFDFVYELELTDDIPIVVNQGGKRTILLLQLNIDAKIKAYLESSGILDRIEDLEYTVEDLEDKIDDLEDKIKELEESGGGSGSGSGDDTTGNLTKKKLKDCTWAQIKAYADAGTASEVFDVGDTKDINTADGVRTMVLADFENVHFTDLQGTPLPMVFVTLFAGYKAYARSTNVYAEDSFAAEIESFKNGFDPDLSSILEFFNVSNKSVAVMYTQGAEASGHTCSFGGYTGKVMAVPFFSIIAASGWSDNYIHMLKYYENLGGYPPIQISNNGNGSIVEYWLAGIQDWGSTYGNIYRSTGSGWSDAKVSTGAEYHDVFVFCI